MATRTNWWLAAAGAAAGLFAYARVVEPRWLQVSRPTIHLRRLPRGLEGLRVGLLTDLHAGGVTPLSLVRRAVQLVMAERPHLIALTGDFADDEAPDFADVFDALCGLHAPYGVYAVPGNHDYVVGIEEWHRQIGAYPHIRDLTNRAVTLRIGEARLCIAGVDDLYRGEPRLVLPLAWQRDLTILLAHSPDQAERSRRAADAIDLILAGHTHGGQVQLPGGVVPVTSAEHEELYVEGLRRRPWTQVYISRGIGTVGPPVRFLARPEVTVLRLTASARSADRGRRPPRALLGRSVLTGE